MVARALIPGTLAALALSGPARACIVAGPVIDLDGAAALFEQQETVTTTECTRIAVYLHDVLPRSATERREQLIATARRYACEGAGDDPCPDPTQRGRRGDRSLLNNPCRILEHGPGIADRLQALLATCDAIHGPVQ